MAENNEDTFKTPEERLQKFTELDETIDNENNRTANDHKEGGNSDEPNLSTQGEGHELKDNLGGGTNLSLDQLKDADNNSDQ